MPSGEAPKDEDRLGQILDLNAKLNGLSIGRVNGRLILIEPIGITGDSEADFLRRRIEELVLLAQARQVVREKLAIQ